MNITSLPHNCYTRSISTLHYSNIMSYCSGSTYLIPSDIQLYTCRSFSFHSLKGLLHIPSPITYGTVRNCCSYLATSNFIQDRDQLTKTQCSVPSAPEKLTEGHSRTWRLPAPTRIAVHILIKPVMVYESAKLVMQKIRVVLSSGNVRNMALESPKLLYHLLQFMNNQIDPLLLENLAPFA